MKWDRGVLVRTVKWVLDPIPLADRPAFLGRCEVWARERQDEQMLQALAQYRLDLQMQDLPESLPLS